MSYGNLNSVASNHHVSLFFQNQLVNFYFTLIFKNFYQFGSIASLHGTTSRSRQQNITPACSGAHQVSICFTIPVYKVCIQINLTVTYFRRKTMMFREARTTANLTQAMRKALIQMFHHSTITTTWA